MNESEQRELLATACHILYKLGLSDYLGHPSVRLDAERVLASPAGRWTYYTELASQ